MPEGGLDKRLKGRELDDGHPGGDRGLAQELGGERDAMFISRCVLSRGAIFLLCRNRSPSFPTSPASCLLLFPVYKRPYHPAFSILDGGDDHLSL